MTVITRVHPVYLMNLEQCQLAADPQTKPLDVDCESIYSLWPVRSTFAACRCPQIAPSISTVSGIQDDLRTDNTDNTVV